MENSLEMVKAGIVEDFSLYDEWLDKYEYLIDLGKSLDAYPETEKTEDKLIKGCQSRVWLNYEIKDGKIYFNADSDAIITKGIISLLIKVYSGRTAEEIANDDFSFIDEIGLKENLSPSRSNGLSSMIERIREIAKSELSKNATLSEPTTTNDNVLTAEDVKALEPLYSDVILALKQVYDPEIPVNIYDLGLIYELNISKDRKVHITMTFTAPNCPMADEVLADVHYGVMEVPGVEGCDIELVFEPAWDQSMLSEEARITLGYDI